MEKHKIEWLDPDRPEILIAPITLEDNTLSKLGLSDPEPDQLQVELYLDMVKVVSVRHRYPNETDEPCMETCVVTAGGESSFVIDLPLQMMLHAWKMHKQWMRR